MTKGGVLISPDSAVADIRAAAQSGNLVVVIGTGVSLAMTNATLPSLSWQGLIKNGISYCSVKGLINDEQKARWDETADSVDMDDLLGAAEFLTRKLDAPNSSTYARWLRNNFHNITTSNSELSNALKTISSAGIPICTLNYDLILEDVLSVDSITLSTDSQRDLINWVRGHDARVLHLHGSWQEPASCILGIRDYQSTQTDEVRALLQRSLGAFKQLLFIGCGGTFADPNFSSLISWISDNIPAAAPSHYAIVRNDEVQRRRSDPNWGTFVEPVGYGALHQDLSSFLSTLFSDLAPRPVTAELDPGASDEVIDAYKKYLLRDCGLITVEGLPGAELGTGPTQFAIEDLFVPLKVEPPEPQIPLEDAEREKKLQEWRETLGKPVPFGKAFSEHRRLALLALPGGGKTLLLKRLAVAYCDETRRALSDDSLPDIRITPVVIRCREWRQHISEPIPELINRIPAVTGQLQLEGIRSALMPLFKSGRAMLLIDGLDEIHNEGDRKSFVENLGNFLSDYPETRLVVTSREAGFSLVAPNIASFCERYRVSPLDDDAILKLCLHWHNTVASGAPSAEGEARDLSSQLINTPSLKRLATNPLLLTMLLIVKHGEGRLPADRVGLYERAVEILLNTWNIRGHDPLNPKEAVPQLSYVAFQLMKAGKQTATLSELLSLVEAGRDGLARIRRYAKLTPSEFLSKVELRSSLLLEAGHRTDARRAVPFYQFRHLTFQEYLAAVGAAHGYYAGNEQGDGVLKPLKDHLLSDEWKEIIPMAAVLAGRQNEDLILALLDEGEPLVKDLSNGDYARQAALTAKLPAPVSRLARCLMDEAEFSPTLLVRTIDLVLMFVHGGTQDENWTVLMRGPYAKDVLSRFWDLYEKMDWPAESWLRTSYANLASLVRATEDWFSDEGQAELASGILADDHHVCGQSLLVCSGLYWHRHLNRGQRRFSSKVKNAVALRLSHDSLPIRHAAMWAWALFNEDQKRLKTNAIMLDSILKGLEGELSNHPDIDMAEFCLAHCASVRRDDWRPTLSPMIISYIRETFNPSNSTTFQMDRYTSAFLLAYYNRGVYTDEDLIDILEGQGGARIPAVSEAIKRQLRRNA